MVDATTQAPRVAPISLSRCQTQHQRYVEALASLGVRLRWATAADHLADSVFVEDQAVVLGDVVLLTQSGHLPRRAERPGIEAALPAGLRVVRMDGAASLDGGDVLLTGEHLFVGRSSRTNDAGVAQLADAARPLGLRLHEVEVPGDLHLKCSCSPLGEGVVLASPRAPVAALTAHARVLHVDEAESYAANIVAIGRSALVAAGFPGVLATLRGAGWSAIEVDVSEIARADGSLTCMSVLGG